VIVSVCVQSVSVYFSVHVCLFECVRVCLCECVLCWLSKSVCQVSLIVGECLVCLCYHAFWCVSVSEDVNFKYVFVCLCMNVLCLFACYCVVFCVCLHNAVFSVHFSVCLCLQEGYNSA
jgi:hypothetical protein